MGQDMTKVIDDEVPIQLCTNQRPERSLRTLGSK